MKRRRYKTKRAIYLALGAISIAIGATLLLQTFRDNLVFFFSPTELMAKNIEDGRLIRVGGLVQKSTSYETSKGMLTLFTLTDNENILKVSYSGILPNLYREGQGVVAEGALKNGHFIAKRVLAKHDEKYMPPEVADSLKEKGYWKPEEK